MDISEYYKLIDINEIDRFITEEQEENVQLEFKILNYPSKDGRDSDIKNYSKALSGFANSTGGVVIWGIKAQRKKETDIDCASELRPIKNVKMAINWLNRLESTLVSPGVLGVTHKPVYLINSKDEGFVKTYIPKSDDAPHMGTNDKQYFKRLGDSFISCEHYEVIDMMNRPKKAKLKLHLDISEPYPSPNQQTKFIHRVKVSLYNEGKSLAQFPFLNIVPLRFEIQPYEYGLDGNRNTGLTRRKISDPIQFIYGGNNNTVIFPGQNLDIDYLAYETSYHDLPQKGMFQFKYQIACENMEIVAGSVNIDFHLKEIKIT